MNEQKTFYLSSKAFTTPPCTRKAGFPFLDIWGQKEYDYTVITSHSQTDSFGRKVFEESQLGWGCVSRQFDYVVGTATDEHKDNGKVKSSPVCHLVSQIVLSDERTLTYEYDAEERITKVIDSVDGEWVYTYDALGQLLTEQHKAVDADSYTTVNAMEYDNYGNITKKNGVKYTYGNTKWKDLLTWVGNQSITYDAQGNPVTYLGHTLTWEKGRQLKSFDGITYTYNANGFRTTKTVDGVKHTYVLDGTTILRESWGENTLIPLYDNEDSVCGIIYNAIPYYFLKNLQGDVIAITDRDGEVVARYTYDAWGKVTSITGSLTVIATINPFRYRGYYYDAETGLYYLQSRYYDPETGRFVNADEAETVKLTQNFLYTNLFAYCLNTPINSSDSSGKLTAQIIARIILGAMLGFLIQLLCDLIESWYIVYIQKKKDNRKLCVGDYLSSMLSWSLVFLSPASKTIRAVLALLPYYVKILGRAVNNNYPWQSLLIDLVSALIATIVSVCLGANKVTARQLSKIQARFMGSKNALQKVANTATNLVIRMNKWGFRLNVAVNISNAFMQLLFNILAYKKY